MTEKEGRHDGGFSFWHAPLLENADEMLPKFVGRVDPRDLLRLTRDLSQTSGVCGSTLLAFFGQQYDVDHGDRYVHAEEQRHGRILGRKKGVIVAC